jgi:hypothetical protein
MLRLNKRCIVQEAGAEEPKLGNPKRKNKTNGCMRPLALGKVNPSLASFDPPNKSLYWVHVVVDGVPEKRG